LWLREIKCPFVAAISLSAEGRPYIFKIAPVPGFTRKAIVNWANEDLAPGFGSNTVFWQSQNQPGRRLPCVRFRQIWNSLPRAFVIGLTGASILRCFRCDYSSPLPHRASSGMLLRQAENLSNQEILSRVGQLLFVPEFLHPLWIGGGNPKFAAILTHGNVGHKTACRPALFYIYISKIIDQG